MTETTTQTLSPGTKDGLLKAARIIGGNFTFADTPSGYDYWYNAYIKLYELSGTVPGDVPPFGPLCKSTPGKVGKRDPSAEGPEYSGKIRSWKELKDAASYIADMGWTSTSSGGPYWYDVYCRVLSFVDFAKEKSKNELAGGVTKGQEEKAKKASQSGPKPGPMEVCFCGHAYHAHSKKRGCKFHAKDGCLKFAVKPVSDVMAVEPSAAPQSKPEDFLEL